MKVKTYCHDVSTHNCSFARRGEEGALGDFDVNRLQAALVEWDILRNETSQAVNDSGVSDGFRGIGVGYIIISNAIASLTFDNPHITHHKLLGRCLRSQK